MENFKCKDVGFGTNKCVYEIFLPWKCKFSWESDDKLVSKCVAIDKCILPEILKLWGDGIRTGGCCCGHGNQDMAFISVRDDYVGQMVERGYEPYALEDAPNKRIAFIPKTKFYYKT
jgi:hypothetical protein